MSAKGIALPPEFRRRVYLFLLFLVSTGLTLLAVIAPLLQSSLSPVARQGDVAERDYRAPQAVTFASEVLTEQRREAAERAVSPIFSSPDTRVARRQLEQLRATLAYLNSVRADSFAPMEQKLSDLVALDDIRLSPETSETILGLADARWQEIQQESIVVLERVMSSAIRPESLGEARSRLPALVTLSLPEEQANVVAELASAYVAPNSQYSEELTQAAREIARQEVEPVMRSFVPGQTVVLQGQVLGPEDIEALHQLGLTTPEFHWSELASAAALSLVLVAFVAFYLRRKQKPLVKEVRSLTVVCALLVFFLVSARLAIPNNPFIQYAFPLASYGMVAAALFGSELAFITSLPLAILAAVGLPSALELTLFYLISSLFGILALGSARRLVTFLWAGLAVAVSGSIVAWIYFLLPSPTDSLQSFSIVTLAAFFNGLASTSVAILLHSFLARYLGLVTPIQLLDLTRPDHPLLRRLLRETPGTYQHSLQVANLAEQAAERIGVDPMLIRAGSLYHDIGKTANPGFFIENQPPGLENPHDSLAPEESTRIIIRHVSDGLLLARKSRLPRRIQDFISEHHGTTLASYQYYNALQAVGGDEKRVNKDLFRYPGPRPQSRETALLMLADACEARVRAERPTDDDSLRGLIKNIIADRIAKEQLDDTRLTLRDLNEIVESFTATLRGVYHPRISYPGLEVPATQTAITLPLPRKSKTPADADLH